jgi:predicted nucleic acid-binding protein
VAASDPPASVVCDAGPLIHLDELGCVDLLSDFAVVQVPETVWQEVKRHRPSALRRRSVKLERVVASPAPSPELLHLTQDFLLDAGELDALKLMQEGPGAILLTDDVAEHLKYEVHGTIGVVVRALQRSQRTKRQVLNVLRALPERSTPFIEAKLLAWVIEEVREA